MAYTDQKTKTTDSRPGVTVTQSNKGSGATVAYIISAIVVVLGADHLLLNNPTTTKPVVPSVTNNTTVNPAPDAVTPAPVTPAPDAATPPAMETAPAAPAPTTPPAANP